MTWVGRTWWQLKLAEGWEAMDEPDCLTITRSDDAAFQLSGAVKTSGEILMSELEEMCEKESPTGAERTLEKSGAFSGYGTTYSDDGVLWKKYWLANGGLLVFATYNGTPAAWATDSHDVKTMLNSLRPLPAANREPI